LAGFSGAVLTLAGANVGSVLGALHGGARYSAGISLLVGVLLLVASLVTALRGTLLPGFDFDVSAKEVANYLSDRFIGESDLWRVHLRAVRGVLDSIEVTSRECDESARAVERAESLFLLGLAAVGLALAILIVVVTF
jgi:hypothetical protein